MVMTELLNLGRLYVSDFLAPGEQPRAEPAELRLVMDDDGLVHLAEQPAPELMWGRYWYRSGTNATMRNELAGIVDQITDVVEVGDEDVWVDIASNDGTLLSQVDEFVTKIAVDPCEFARDAEPWTDWVLQEPFTRGIAQSITDYCGQAKVITCIAMFYDLPDPTDFLAGVHHLLADDGIFVLQVSYTPLMLEQLAFDNICHEHARYYTLTTLLRTLVGSGFYVLDAQLNDTNGGSMRVYAQRQGAKLSAFATQPYRDVAEMRVHSLLNNEHARGYNKPGVWQGFSNRLFELKGELTRFIEGAHDNLCSVWAYGASTKGNTLLQYFGLDHTLIDGIAERQEAKWALRTVGTNIPIYSEEDMRKAKPDYALVLPWQFIGEFVKREADYLAGGGKFIVPCPRFEVIG